MVVESSKRRKSEPDEAENTEDTLHVPAEETASQHDAARSVQDVRQGHTGDHLRYILIASFGGIVLLFALVLGLYAI